MRRPFRLADAGWIDRPGGGGEDKRLQLAGRLQRVFDRGPAAHRLGNEAHLGEAQMVDQRREVASEVGGIWAAGNGRGGSKSAVREGDAGVAGSEMGDLLPPR